MTSTNSIVQKALNAKACNSGSDYYITYNDGYHEHFRGFGEAALRQKCRGPGAQAHGGVKSIEDELEHDIPVPNETACNAKFKVGDKVRARPYTSGVGGKVGTVVKVWKDDDGWDCITVDHGNGNRQENFAGNYEKVENSVARNGGSFGDVAPNTAKAWHEIMNKCGSANGWQIDVIGAAKKDGISTSELMSVKKPYDDAIQAAYTAAQKAFNYFSSKK